ncbi:MAG: sigma factor-like helix-turn-helix DNA-binding protein [Christensenellales bacterium]|jgi:DNA-directed RNA polymerase specialized sigma24 family protein
MELAELREKRQRIDSLKERIKYMDAAGALVRAVLFSGGKEPIAQQCSSMSRAADLLYKEIHSLESGLSKAEEAISGLPANERQVLRLRYICALSWADISRRCHYSERHCRRLHAKALLRLKQQSDYNLNKTAT